MPERHHTRISTLALLAALSVAPLALPATAHAQIVQAAPTDKLDLAPDSPFRDPDIVYLEADELSNDEAAGILTASGEVEGRYEDKTLRAERVIYYLETGRIIASGNVVLVQADGSSQYADKLELSGELEAGTASNFVARTPQGGLTAARFVARNSDEEIELYNAYYTACEVCEGTDDKPSWRLKARRVQQDKSTRTVRYRDATLELFGLPVFYTPYLAHPDPSVDRASGFLMPFLGLSASKGPNFRAPYYWAIDDYTELTVTPRVFAKVNPVLGYQFARQFNTGKLTVDGSFTYASVFDRDGDPFQADQFNTTENVPLGKRLRSHIYADGLFAPNDTWTYGFALQLVSDDTYLDRYDFDENRQTSALYAGESRRNTSQAYIVGQDNDEDFRLSVSTVGFQDLRTTFREVSPGVAGSQLRVSRVDDSILPIIAPKIEVEKYIDDPVLDGRLRLFGDATFLTRKVGSDYSRASAGADWSKSWIAPGGLEVKPFAFGRVDTYDLQSNDSVDGQPVVERNFTRAVGQVGTDIRYPFIRRGANTTWVIEPRVQVTQSFGDAKLDRFVGTVGTTEVSLDEDIGFTELDPLKFWQANKASGYDFWQEGGRADIGGSVRVDWGGSSRVEAFAGRSYAWDIEDDYRVGSGLEGLKSDYVAELNLKLGRTLNWKTRTLFDPTDNRLRRLESEARIASRWLDASARYYRIDNAVAQNPDELFIPPEEISGAARFKIDKNWSVGYAAFHDIDRDLTRRQAVTLGYRDDCTLIELEYTRNNFDSDVVRDNEGFGLRISLLTLGSLDDN